MPPWLTPVAGVIVAVVFALWLAGSGPTGTTGSASSPAGLGDAGGTGFEELTLPPTTLPRLDGMLPWLNGRLLLFTEGPDGASTLLWRSDQTAPVTFRLSGSSIDRIVPDPRALDRIAYETTGSVQSLFYGGLATQEPLFVGSAGFGWDPLGSGTLMWVGTDQVTGITSLYRRAPGDPVELVAAVPSGTRLMAWAEQGLITAEPIGDSVFVVSAGLLGPKRPTLTVLRDPTGVVLASAVAEPLRATTNGAIVAVGSSGVFAAAGLEVDPTLLAPPDEVVVLDAANGAGVGMSLRSVPTRETLDDGESMFSRDGLWSLSADGKWVGRTVNHGLSTTLAIQSLDTSEVRTIAVGGSDNATVGFSRDGAWFFAWSDLRSELVAISMRGPQFTVPLGSSVRFEGAYVWGQS